MLCCAVLCCAVLCCAVLCCAVLCHAVFHPYDCRALTSSAVVGTGSQGKRNLQRTDSAADFVCDGTAIVLRDAAIASSVAGVPGSRSAATTDDTPGDARCDGDSEPQGLRRSGSGAALSTTSRGAVSLRQSRRPQSQLRSSPMTVTTAITHKGRGGEWAARARLRIVVPTSHV